MDASTSLKVDNPKLSLRYPGILKYSGTILDFFSFSPEVSSWEYELNDKEINNKIFGAYLKKPLLNF